MDRTKSIYNKARAGCFKQIGSRSLYCAPGLPGGDGTIGMMVSMGPLGAMLPIESFWGTPKMGLSIIGATVPEHKQRRKLPSTSKHSTTDKNGRLALATCHLLHSRSDMTKNNLLLNSFDSTVANEFHFTLSYSICSRIRHYPFQPAQFCEVYAVKQVQAHQGKALPWSR